MLEFIPNAVERISKGTKAVADPGGGSGGGGVQTPHQTRYLFETKILTTIGLDVTV